MELSACQNFCFSGGSAKQWAMTKETVLIWTSLAVMAIALTACTNTLHGMGRDVRNTGQTIENTF
jgi:predicted small secreted protein